VPVGAELEYTDVNTIAQAMLDRRRMSATSRLERESFARRAKVSMIDATSRLERESFARCTEAADDGRPVVRAGRRAAAYLATTIAKAGGERYDNRDPRSWLERRKASARAPTGRS